MSKMAEMAQTIEELRSAAASINAAADWLYQQFSGDEVAAPEAPAPAAQAETPAPEAPDDLFSGVKPAAPKKDEGEFSVDDIIAEFKDK